MISDESEVYMSYWITLVILCVFACGLIYFMWRERAKKEVCYAITALLCIPFLFIVIMGLDIPNALKGGEEIYVNELPERIGTGRISYTITDDDTLRHLQGCNWNKYEKYGNYRIRYTKLTKFVLDVEKLE